MPKWELERQCFKDAVVQDVQTGKQGRWPRIKPVEQIVWEQFLEKIVDPESGHYYPKRDEDGKPVKTPGVENPRYSVITITRYKNREGKEFLLSKGYWHAFDSLGDPVKRYVSYPELWKKTNFEYVKDWNPKKKAIEKQFKGIAGVEEVYTLEFNEHNLKQLFDKRQDDYTSWVLKDDRIVKAVALQPNINDTFKLFLKPFDYLVDAQYMTPEMKAQYRQEAIDQGLLAAPPTPSGTVSVAAGAGPETGRGPTPYTANYANPNNNAPRMHIT